MLVVETLVALAEHSLLCEPAPVPAFQLVLNSVGAGQGTSRSAVADVLTESAAASIVRHLACVPPHVQADAVLEALATAWVDLGAVGGAGGVDDPRLTDGSSRWGPPFVGGSGGNSNGRAFMGFGLSRVVPLDPLVAFVAVAGGGSLEERANAAFWTLDRDGAGYLTLEQLLRLSGMLVAVAAAGRVVLNLPPLPHDGAASELSLGHHHHHDNHQRRANSGASAGHGPNPCGISSGQDLRPPVYPAPPPPPDLGSPPPPGTDPGGIGGGGAVAAGIGQPPFLPAAAATAVGVGGGGAAGGESRALLDAALTGAYRKHCLPAEGPAGPPARLTADRLALVIQSAVEYITLAVVRRATTAHMPGGDGAHGSNLHGTLNHHNHNGHNYGPHHVRGRSFGSGGATTAMARSSSHAHHPHPHHQRQASAPNTRLPGAANGAAPPPPPLPTGVRLQRPWGTGAVTALVADCGSGSGSGSYSPAASQVQLQGIAYGGVAALSHMSLLQKQQSLELALDRTSSNTQNPYMSAAGVPYGRGSDGAPAAAAAAATGPYPSQPPRPEGSVSGAAASLADGAAPPLVRPAAVATDMSRDPNVLRRRSSSATASMGASAAAAATNAAGLYPSAASSGERMPAAASSAAAATSSWPWAWGWAKAQSRTWPVPAARAPTTLGAATAATAAAAATATAAAAGLTQTGAYGAGGNGGGTAQHSFSWVGGSIWAATSYIGGAVWGLGRSLRSAPAAAPADRPGVSGVAAAVPPGYHAPRAGGPSPTGGVPAAAPPRSPPTSSAPTVSPFATLTGLAPQTRGSPLGRVSEHPDLPGSPLARSPVRQVFAAAAVSTPSSVGSNRPGGSGDAAAAAATGSPQRGAAPGGPGAEGGGSQWVWQASTAVASAAVEVSPLTGPEAAPALRGAFGEAGDTSSRPTGGGGGGEGGGGLDAGCSAAATAATVGAAASMGEQSTRVGNPGRTMSGLVNKWLRPSRSSMLPGDAGGSPRQSASALATAAMQSPGGASAATGPIVGPMEQSAAAAGRDGPLLEDCALVAAPAAANASDNGNRRRTSALQGFAGGAGGGGGSGVGGDGSVHGGGGAAVGGGAPPPLPSRTLGGGLDTHLLLTSIAHAPHYIEEAATRAEVAAKAEAAAAASRGGAAAATAGGAGAAAGGREAAAAPAHGAAGASGGGTVLPPLQRAIRTTVQQAGVKLFLHCGVCLLAIIALLLLDAALVAWIYLDRKQRLSRSLVIVAATNTGLVLLVMLITIVRSCMTDRASAIEAAAAARQRAGSVGAGGGGGAGGVLGFLLSNFVTPTLQTMGIIRGPEDASGARAAPAGAGGGSGGHEGGGWGSRLRVLWTTIGRVAGFDASPEDGGAGAGGPSSGDHGELEHAGSNMVGSRYDYVGPHVAIDMESGAGGAGSRGPAGIGGGRLPSAAGSSTQLATTPFSPGGGAGVSPFSTAGMGGPDGGAMVGPESLAGGAGARAPACGGGGGAGLAADPRVVTYPLTGTAARERTRGSALPATYYASVPTLQRVEAAYPAL